jgi:molecular chaperone DnaK (HSP70)
VRKPAPSAYVGKSAMAEAADESILLLDIAPVSILVADHKGDFIRVVARNTMIPNRKTKSIVLASENTQQVEVSVSVTTNTFTQQINVFVVVFR